MLLSRVLQIPSSTSITDLGIVGVTPRAVLTHLKIMLFVINKLLMHNLPLPPPRYLCTTSTSTSRYTYLISSVLFCKRKIYSCHQHRHVYGYTCAFLKASLASTSRSWASRTLTARLHKCNHISNYTHTREPGLLLLNLRQAWTIARHGLVWDYQKRTCSCPESALIQKSLGLKLMVKYWNIQCMIHVYVCTKRVHCRTQIKLTQIAWLASIHIHVHLRAYAYKLSVMAVLV